MLLWGQLCKPHCCSTPRQQQMHPAFAVIPFVTLRWQYQVCCENTDKPEPGLVSAVSAVTQTLLAHLMPAPHT